VTVAVTSEGEKVCVSVADRGMGIPAEDLANLFGRFYRAHNAEAHQITGMGIGLFVVKEIVTLHGGTVEVASTEGIGSTFTICLPRAALTESGESLAER
jgi:signal transduction histidine kinase